MHTSTITDTAQNALSPGTLPGLGAAPPERRPKRRHRVLAAGVIAFEEGGHKIDCTIRDLSESGARVALAPGAKFPASLYLVNVRDRIAYEAHVIWSGASETGLVFSQVFPLTRIADPALNFLRRIWIERATR